MNTHENISNARKAINRLIYTPLFDAELAGSLEEGLKSASNTESRNLASLMLKDAGDLLLDGFYGTMDENFFSKYYGTEKSVQGELLPATPGGGGILNVFLNQGDEIKIDMEWMPVFDMADLRSSRFGIITDIISLVKWGAYGQGEPIKLSPYMSSTFATLGRQRYGGGVSIDRYEQQVTTGAVFAKTLNNIIAAMRYKAVINKKDVAYAIMQAAIAAANTATYTTAFVTGDLPQTLDNGVVALNTRLSNKGFEVSDSDVIHLYASRSLRSKVEAAFRATNGDDGENITAPTNVVRHYTYNLASTLGISGSKVALVYPGKKNIWGDFAGLQFEQETKMLTNGINVAGQEDYNAQMNTEQVQIVTIA
jgi:hypothetical protein